MSGKEEFNIYKVLGTKLKSNFSDEQLSILDPRLHEAVWVDPPSKEFNETLKDEKDGDFKLLSIMIRDSEGEQVLSEQEFKSLGVLQVSILRNFTGKITTALFNVLTEGMKKEVDSEEGKPTS